MSEKSGILKAAGVLGSATMLSRILGMVRDMVVARLFGAGMATDAFFAAFQIPNLLRRFFAEGALTSAFVPTFSETLVQEGEERARELANLCFTLLTLVVAVVTLLGIVFSPLLVHLMFPGFTAVPGKFELTVLLNRVMFPYLFFISLVALCMGILNTLRHFFTPAISTVFLNLSMIVCALALRPFYQYPITALAVGVLLGGLIQLVMQLPVLWKMGYPVRPRFDFRDPKLRRIALLLAPATLGVGVYYLNITVGNILASLLPQGSVSYLYYAQRLFEFPQGVFTVSVAQAVLPALSRQAAEGDLDAMKETLNYGVRLTLFITIPALVGLTVCAEPLMVLLFMGGQFDHNMAVQAARALIYYSLGLSCVALVRVVAPAFYALQDTRTPVLAAFVAFLLNLGFSLALMGPLQHGGLALASSLSALGNMGLLFWLLRRRVGSLGGKRLLRTALLAACASLPMGALTWWLMGRADWSQPGMKLLKSAHLAGGVALAIACYLLAARLLRSEEATEMIALVRRKLAR
ncbi:murein biosynthesis integral membrane protein MurJ [Trichlorobacter ammonificans]|uniref:Probable lipid II flippase MurJ n=1 Tax=Trichlorobacter ammonificans TaxID=2916410 RepID=A0ABN8HDE2_9BACT|nr:murein biosynthesis integral membrane protein MurJ [Trichlorobacter ammonificans]CAH2030810.1 putative lipid II flippase MurJ [Trichlorobacter ammonificans]